MLVSSLDSTLRLMEKSSGRLLQAFKSPDVSHATMLLLLLAYLV
jgi:hypothetical protein